MPIITSEHEIPLGVRFTITSDGDQWRAIILREALLVLGGDSPLSSFNGSKDRVINLAMAKIALGETFEGELIISLADVHRPDLDDAAAGFPKP